METKLAFAEGLIRQAGQLVREQMCGKLVIESKGACDDLVTNLDKAVQHFWVERILAHYPTDQILAEEEGLQAPYDQGSVWILDPIDGTLNFIVQGDEFSLMMAYFEEGQGKFALIYDVMKDILYKGLAQGPVTKNQEILSPYKKRPLSESLIACNARLFASNSYHLADLAQETLGVRMYGAAGISMGHVLSGRLLAYFSNLYPWDYAAAGILGNSLGYEVLTLDGQQPDYTSRQLVMFVPSLYKESLMSYLQTGQLPLS